MKKQSEGQTVGSPQVCGQRKAYQPPSLTNYGTVREITLGTGATNNADNPAGPMPTKSLP